LIPGYYSGTSPDEKFIQINDFRNSEAPETDLSQHKDRDLEINRFKMDTRDAYRISTFQLNNGQLKEHTDFSIATNADYDKASYKWENDSTVKFVIINSSNMATLSYRIIHYKKSDNASLIYIGIHAGNKK
jgi:hypothetical protein